MAQLSIKQSKIEHNPPTMKVQVTAKFGGETRALLIACGDGKRTFKWLAMAAGQQLAQLQPNGRVRVRDQSRLPSSRGLLHPKRVFTESCPFLHPNALISDYLQPQETVAIEFSSEMPVDTCGIPALEDWQKLAFIHSEDQLEAVDEVMQKLSAQLSAAEMAGRLENVRAREAETRRAAHFMKQMLRSQMIDEAKGYQQVEDDWDTLCMIHRDLPDGEMMLIKQQTFTYFLCFHDLAAKFSVDKQVSLERLLSLVQLTGIFSAGQLPKTQLAEMFQITQIALGTAATESERPLSSAANSPAPGSVGGLSRVGLVSILIRIAAFRFVGTFDVEALEKLRHDSLGHRISVPSHSQAFHMLLEQYIMPYLEKEQSECTVKATVMADETLALLRRHHDDLSAVFLRYCQRRGEAYSVLRIQDLIVLFADSGLTPESQERTRPRHHQHLSMEPGSELHNWASELLRGCRNPFNVGKLPSGVFGQDQDSDDSISYAEVVEMLVRIGLLQLKPALGVGLERIEVAANKMAALATAGSNSTKP